MNCVNCGGVLSPKSVTCPYCKSVNDVDLRNVFRVAQSPPETTRNCPHCDATFELLDVGLGTAFLIERCPSCLGMFFDPGELDAVVAARTQAAASIDYSRLDLLVQQETPEAPDRVRYIRCPTCHELMNRRGFGARSGVIADECKEHGIWLDGGELRRIMTWVRAGGLELKTAVEAERKKVEEREKRFDAKLSEPKGGWSDDTPVYSSERMAGGAMAEVILVALRTIFRF